MDNQHQRVDVRMGNFACSIDGFDDPAAVLQAVLATLGKAVEATPAIAEQGLALDEETLGQLREKAASATGQPTAEIDAVPGLVVVAMNGTGAARTPELTAQPPIAAEEIREALEAASSIRAEPEIAEEGSDEPRRGWPAAWHLDAEETAEAPFPEDVDEDDTPPEPAVEVAAPPPPRPSAPLYGDEDAGPDPDPEADPVDAVSDEAAPVNRLSALFARSAEAAEDLGEETADEEEAPAEPLSGEAEDPIIARLRRVAAERRGEVEEAETPPIDPEEVVAPTIPKKTSPLQRRGRRPRNIFGSGTPSEAEPTVQRAVEPAAQILAEPAATSGEAEPIMLDAAMMLDTTVALDADAASVSETVPAGDQPGEIATDDDGAPVDMPASGPTDEVPEPAGRPRRRSLFAALGGGTEAEAPATEADTVSERRSYHAEETPGRRPRPPMTAQALAWKMEAHKPDDQLIAAAAFLTYVEKKPRYSRREVFKVLDTIPGEIVRNLEVRVKNFGRLVRDGVFVQLDTDSFTLSDGQLERLSEYFDD